MKAKWRGLRDNFRLELKKLDDGKSGDPGGVSKQSKWAHFSRLSFLKDFMSKRNVSSNSLPVEQEIENHSEEIYYEETNENDIKYEPLTNIDSISTSSYFQEYKSPVKRKKISTDELVSVGRERIEIYKTISDIFKEDEEYHFVMSLIPELKKISSSRKLITKIKIQQLILEAQQNDDS